MTPSVDWIKAQPARTLLHAMVSAEERCRLFRRWLSERGLVPVNYSSDLDGVLQRAVVDAIYDLITWRTL